MNHSLKPSSSHSIRLLQASEVSQLDQLVSNAFQYRAPHHFLQDFPVWKSEDVHRYGIFESETLCSHVGLRVVEYQLGTSSSLRLGLIGAVATDAAWRGKGLSTRLLQHVIQQAQTTLKLDWLILWGSEHEFYKKLGFNLDGVQWRVPLHQVLIDSKSSSMTVQKGYTPQIFDWLFKHSKTAGLRWQESDRSWFEAHSTVDWYWTANPFSFAGVGRGMDLGHLVHEIGGDPTGLASVLRRIHQIDPQAELLTHPSEIRGSGLKEMIPPSASMMEEKLCLSCPVSQRAKQMATLGSTFWISGLQAC